MFMFMCVKLLTYHNVVNAHAHKSGIIDLLQLDAACLVCQKDAKDQQDSLVSKQHPWRSERNLYLLLEHFSLNKQNKKMMTMLNCVKF